VETQKIGVSYWVEPKDVSDDFYDKLGDIACKHPFVEEFDGPCVTGAGGITFKVDPKGLKGVNNVRQAESLVRAFIYQVMDELKIPCEVHAESLTNT
jgi:hypothetical protein